jgi:general secretion pathway protein D
MKSAEEVPFVTGQYTSGTATTNGVVNPFQTVQQEEVGTILKVTPTIAAEGNEVMLKISIESSSLGALLTGTTNYTTNKRQIETNVLIEDGGVVVLGGLISDQVTHTEAKVPVLGSIPLLGELFKSRSDDHTKTNLMIFIRPTIIRQQSQTAYATESKYNYMIQEEKKNQNHSLVPLLPGDRTPVLPKLPAPPTSANPGELAPASAAEKEKAAERASSGNTLPGEAPKPPSVPAPAPSTIPPTATPPNPQ